MTARHHQYQTKTIEFRLLWLSVEKTIGNAFIPLCANAESVQEFVSNIDSQSNPLYSVIKDTFKIGGCHTLDSPIDPFIVLDVLGETLFKQKNNEHVDVTLIDQIERIGLHICQKYLIRTPTTKKQLTDKNTHDSPVKAQIISINYWQKKRNI